MLSLGPSLPLAFLFWLSPACLSASGGGWAGPLLASSPLVFSQSFVLWAGWQCLRLELFTGKFSLSLFFPLSLAILQFGLLSHVSSLRLSSGHSGPVLTLSNVARISLFRPRLLVVDVSVWATFLLGVAVRHVICELFIYLFIYFSSQLCCPLRFQNSPQTCWWEGFIVFGNFSSFVTLSPWWVFIPNSFASLFMFYILSYLLSKTMGYLSGCLVSSASVQKLFCGICSAFKWSFDEFVGEKVVSPSYSSVTLGPPSSILNLYPMYNTQPFVQWKPLVHLYCKSFAGNLNYRKKLSLVALNSIAANPVIFSLLSGKVNPLVQCISHTVRFCWLFMFICWMFIPLLFIRSNYKATIMKIMSTESWFSMSALWLFGLLK